MLAGLLFLYTCCMFKRIRLAIAVIKTTAVFINDVKSIYFVPIISSLVLFVFLFMWLIGFFYIGSVGTPVILMTDQLPFASVNWSQDTQIALAYYTFMGIWTYTFLDAVQLFVICSTACIWYFKQESASFPVTKSAYRAFRYYLGSLAFGSLILAIVLSIKYVVMYIREKTKDAASENKCLKYGLDCLLCCIACLQRIVEFINKSAYIQIALQGKGFCAACKDACCIVLENCLRFAAVDGLGSIFVYFGIVFIGAVNAIIGYVILESTPMYKDNISSPNVSVFIMGVFGVCIGGVFMSIYGQSIDAILFSFILDETINKASGRDPQFTP